VDGVCEVIVFGSELRDIVI